MEYIYFFIILILIILFFYYKNYQKKRTQKEFYNELKQKVEDLRVDIDYILNDTLIYLEDKKAFVKLVNQIDEDVLEDDMKYFDLECFLDEEIENILFQIKINKECIIEIKNLEAIKVDKKNIPLSLEMKQYHLEKKQKIINEYKDFYEELNIGDIYE